MLWEQIKPERNIIEIFCIYSHSPQTLPREFSLSLDISPQTNVEGRGKIYRNDFVLFAQAVELGDSVCVEHPHVHFAAHTIFVGAIVPATEASPL